MKEKITVLSLGPGDPGLMTLDVAEALRSGRRLILRTARHPVASWLAERGIAFESMDSFYDQYEDFDRMHEAMAAWLWQEAEKKELLFAVMDPGTDRVVAELKRRGDGKAKLSVLPGISAGTLALSSLPADAASGASAQFFTASDFPSASFLPSLPVLITELDSPLLAGEVKLHLLEMHEDDLEVFFFPPSESVPRPVQRVPLYALDAGKHFDHTAAVYVPGVDYAHRTRHSFDDLHRIVSRLVAPDGCPWDRIQTHVSLRPYMVEEAWEAVGAIEENDMLHLADELGDVLFQVMIHSAIGQRFDEFTVADVISGICEKMIHRHPHVFSAMPAAESAESVSSGWERRKRAETGSKTVGETLNDVSQALPALKYAIKTVKKLAQLPALRRDPARIMEEIRSLSGELLSEGVLSEDRMGELLMKCAELCYRTDQDAEILLHRTVERIKNDYQNAESAIYKDEKNPESLTFQELCVYLNTVEGC